MASDYISDSSGIANSYMSMYDAYSDVWEVSGTGTPTYVWMHQPTVVGSGKNGHIEFYNGDVYSEMDTEGNDMVTDKNLYDIRTVNVYAPISLFSEYKMMQYSGMMGNWCSNDPNATSKYFDSLHARSGLMWAYIEPTYHNILNAYDQIAAAKYLPQHFIYNKYFNFYTPNYLITLRRYANPVTDVPFTLSYSEVLHQEVQPISVQLPLATATTYMGEAAGNKLEDILKFTWGMNWADKEGDIQSLSSGMPGATGFGVGRSLFNSADSGTWKSGLAMSALNMYTGMNVTPAMNHIKDQLAQIDPWSKYSRYTQGPVDVIKKTKSRDQGLNFENNFNLKFDYELKSLQYVNPKIAMLDIIANMITMGTNTGTWWGGATRYYGTGGGYGKQIGDTDAFAKGDYGRYFKSVADHVQSEIKKLGGGQFPKSFGDVWDIVKTFMKGAFANTIGSLINGNLGQLGVTQPANAVLSGDPTGYWHVVVGNPLNPICMMGNMILKQVEMQMGEGLGYDDFPVSVSFTTQIEHGKPRDAGDIESMLNAGKGRYTHTPFMAEIKDLNLPEKVVEQINAVNKQIKESQTHVLNNYSTKGVDTYGGQNSVKYTGDSNRRTRKSKFNDDPKAGQIFNKLVDKLVAIYR